MHIHNGFSIILFLSFSDMINLTISDKYVIIYRKDERVNDWRFGASHIPNLKDTFKLCHMLSVLIFYCHMSNTIIENLNMDQIELGFDAQVLIPSCSFCIT